MIDAYDASIGLALPSRSRRAEELSVRSIDGDTITISVWVMHEVLSRALNSEASGHNLIAAKARCEVWAHEVALTISTKWEYTPFLRAAVPG